MVTRWTSQTSRIRNLSLDLASLLLQEELVHGPDPLPGEHHGQRGHGAAPDRPAQVRRHRGRVRRGAGGAEDSDARWNILPAIKMNSSSGRNRLFPL